METEIAFEHDGCWGKLSLPEEFIEDVNLQSENSEAETASKNRRRNYRKLKKQNGKL